MDLEQQKPITDEYRRNWDRIYREAHVGPLELEAALYPNGCPIIPEGPQRDDL